MSETIMLSLREALLYAQKNERVQQRARSFSALSFKATAGGVYIANGQRITYGPGALCLIPAGVSYQRENEQEDIYVLHFDTSVPLPHKIRVLQIEDVERYRQKFAAALALWQRKAAGDYYRACAILHELFADVIAPVEEAELRHDYLVEALHYMQKHLADPTLSIERLSRRAFVSPANFRRRFAARYGSSPKEYLKALRMKEAKHLLKIGYYSTREIAERCGFSDVGYFCTAFRHHVGVGVAAYRKSAEQEG